MQQVLRAGLLAECLGRGVPSRGHTRFQGQRELCGADECGAGGRAAGQVGVVFVLPADVVDWQRDQAVPSYAE
jgi:hypothetical protein